jgi:hypothetical protein
MVPASEAINVNGRWRLPVPWDRADDVHARLAARGLATILCLDPAERLARLELRPGTDPTVAAAALAELLSPGPSRPN